MSEVIEFQQARIENRLEGIESVIFIGLSLVCLLAVEVAPTFSAIFFLAASLLSLFIGVLTFVRYKAVKQDGLARSFGSKSVMGMGLIHYTYPPLEEWERQLEERGKFKEVGQS